jgi:hypothetical protein
LSFAFVGVGIHEHERVVPVRDLRDLQNQRTASEIEEYAGVKRVVVRVGECAGRVIEQFARMLELIDWPAADRPRANAVEFVKRESEDVGVTRYGGDIGGRQGAARRLRAGGTRHRRQGDSCRRQMEKLPAPEIHQ